MIRLTAVYDERCLHCRRAARWLSKERSYVPLTTVPARSTAVSAPDHVDFVVMGSGGEVWTGASAWRVALWALRRLRRTILRTPPREFESASWRAPHPGLPPGGAAAVAGSWPRRPVADGRSPGVARVLGSVFVGSAVVLAMPILAFLLLISLWSGAAWTALIGLAVVWSAVVMVRSGRRAARVT